MLRQLLGCTFDYLAAPTDYLAAVNDNPAVVIDYSAAAIDNAATNQAKSRLIFYIFQILFVCLWEDTKIIMRANIVL